MSERGPDPVAAAMAGAILGVEEELAEAADVYGQMYAEAYWSAFDDLKGQLGWDVAAVLCEDFQLLFYAFCKRQIEQRVGVSGCDEPPECLAVRRSDSIGMSADL